MDKQGYLFFFGSVGALLGAVTSLGLSFTALPALVIGGIIGSAFWKLCAAQYMVKLLYSSCKGQYRDRGYYIDQYCISVVASAVVGIGLAAVTTATFPSIFATWYTAIAVGAVIGSTATIIGKLTAEFYFQKKEDPSQSFEPKEATTVETPRFPSG